MTSEVHSIGFKGVIEALSLSPENNVLALSSTDYKLRIFDVNDLQHRVLDVKVRSEKELKYQVSKHAGIVLFAADGAPM